MRARAATWILSLTLGLLLCAGLASSAGAGEDEAGKELRALKERVGHMLREAKALDAHGHAEEARAVRARAAELEQHLDRLLAERRQGKEKRAPAARDAKRRKAILRGLGQGIEALQALGGHDELVARLKGLHARVKAGGEDHGEDHGEDQGEDRIGGPERLAHRVEIMRIAAHGLREAERRDLLEVLERAIHTGELVLAGRQDEEARAIMERTPPLGQLARVLRVAAEAWTRFGHETKARHVARLAQHYAERAEAQAREEQTDLSPERLREAEERAERARRAAQERESHEQRRAEELERLHHEMQEIHRALRAMQERLMELTREK